MKIVMFVLLKIIEILVLVFVPYFVGKRIADEDTKFMNWFIGFACIMGVSIASVLIVGVGTLLVAGNLELLKYLGF